MAIFAKAILSTPGTEPWRPATVSASFRRILRSAPPRLPLVRGLLLALPGIPDKTGYPAAIAGESGGQPSPVCRATRDASRHSALSHVRAQSIARIVFYALI